MSISGPDAILKDEKSERWIIRAERRLGDRMGRGEVVVMSESRRPGSEYGKMAAARAWLDIAQQLGAAGDLSEAIRAARAGIDELGDAYKSPTVDDDTDLKLEVAEEQHQEGQLDLAASLFIRMLDTRTQVFAQTHPEMRLG